MISSYLELGRRSPGAVAGGTDDAGLVDVAGADEAFENELVIRVWHGQG
jgi:hypothetical protein